MTPAERVALYQTPAAQLARATNQAPADAFRHHSRRVHWTGTPTAAPRLGLTFRSWTFPVYSASAAAGQTIRVWRDPAAWDEPARWTVPRWPAVIPWHPTWQPAEGEDRGALIDDDPRRPELGGWEILGLRRPWLLEPLVLGWRTGGRYRPGDWIAGMVHRRTPDNVGRYQGRGVGDVPKRAGILTASEVASGHIDHALAMTGLTQCGPGATFVAPATRVEWSAGPPALWLPTGPDPRVMPHGTRLVLRMTSAEIDAWSISRGHQGARAVTACTIARCLAEYGAILSETGVGDPQLETTGAVGPDGPLWRALGIDTETAAFTLLDGLPWDRLEVRA